MRRRLAGCVAVCKPVGDDRAQVSAMKNVLASFLAGIVGMALVLFVYERYLAQPRDARNALQAEEIAASGGGAGRAVAEDMAAAVKQGLGDARDALRGGAGASATVANALTRSAMHKVSVSEWYMSQGQWPESAEQIGLPASAAFAGGGLRGISLLSEGVIELQFDAGFGRSARIRLLPTVHAATGAIEWRCESSGFDDPGQLPEACGSSG
jgi:hypothetical protein